MIAKTTPATDGLHPTLHRDAYDRVERVNFSTLKLFAKSALHYRHALTQPAKDTDAKRAGRIVHLAVFEPERLRSAVAVWDGGARRGKEWEAFRAENRDRELCTEGAYERAIEIQRAVRGNEIAMRYLVGGRGEVSLLWTMGGGEGVNAWTMGCKGRIDFDGAHAIVDLKTTRDASPEGFAREVWRYRYHTQAAWYSDGYEIATGVRKPYYLIAVESEAPHAVQVYRVTDKHIELGREEYQGWLSRLAMCREQSHWPGYADAELDLDLPRWAVFDSEDEDLTGLDLEIAEEG